MAGVSAASTIAIPALRAAERRVTLPLQTPVGSALADGVRLGLVDGEPGVALVLEALDDAGDSERAAANASQLIKAHAPICFAACASLTAARAMAPVLSDAKLPLIGLSTGSEVLRGPEYPLFCNAARRSELP